MHGFGLRASGRSTILSREGCYHHLIPMGGSYARRRKVLRTPRGAINMLGLGLMVGWEDEEDYVGNRRTSKVYHPTTTTHTRLETAALLRE